MFAIIVSILTLLIFTWTLLDYIITYFHWRRRNVKQSIPLPFFGHSFWYFFGLETIYDYILRMCNKHKGHRYFGVYQMKTPGLIIIDPNLISKITTTDFEHFTDHNDFGFESQDSIWNRNVMCLKGDRWRDMRKLLSLAFTNNNLKRMYPSINECAEQFSSFYNKSSKDEFDIEVQDVFERYANDIVAICGYGLKCYSLFKRNNLFYKMAKQSTNFSRPWMKFKLLFLVFCPRLFKLLRIRFVSEGTRNYFLSLVRETIKIREKNKVLRPDMLHILHEAQKKNLACTEMSPRWEIHLEDITAQLSLLFYTGFDVVTSTLTMLAYELAINSEVQERLYNEVNQTWKECNGRLTSDDLLQMTYMDMVICEALRKWPPYFAIDRVCTKNYTIEKVNDHESPVEIRQGDLLMIPIVGIHRDPENFEDPDKFNPERFSDVNKHKIKKNTFIPFGMGPRKCLAVIFALAEIKTIVFYLLLRFEFKASGKTVVPYRMPTRQHNLLNKHGMWLKLVKREKTKSGNILQV